MLFWFGLIISNLRYSICLTLIDHDLVGYVLGRYDMAIYYYKRGQEKQKVVLYTTRVLEEECSNVKLCMDSQSVVAVASLVITFVVPNLINALLWLFKAAAVLGTRPKREKRLLAFWPLSFIQVHQ